jgi:DNA-directed RNA polymerase specialized sigma24 family protein
MLAVHEALDRLAEAEPRQARVAELKIFSGLQNDEIAALLNVSVATVKRDWEAARALLLGILGVVA